MKRLCLLYLIWPLWGVAQSAEQVLESSAYLLKVNESVRPVFMSPDGFFRSRADMLVTTNNYRFQFFNYIQNYEYEQAAEWLEKTARLYPKEAGIVGEIYLSRLRDTPRALAHFNAYDALTPNFDDIIGYNPVSYLRGLAYRNLGDHIKAIDEFSKAIDPLAGKHGSEWVNYRHFVSRAVSYIATQQAEKALADLDKAAQNFSRSALVQYHRGRALLLLNRTAEARTAFQDASFLFKALRVERTGDYQEDDYNPIYEPEIDEALDRIKLNRN